METGIEIKIELDPKSKPNGFIFDIQGSFETGLDKSIINALRRTLLSSTNFRYDRLL